jgi:hypothetical protein
MREHFLQDLSGAASLEAAELKEFQREVNARVPIPPGVTEYEDYRPERRNGRGD